MIFPSFLFFLPRSLFFKFKPCFCLSIRYFSHTEIHCGNIRRYYFSLLFVNFYFTTYVTTEHNNNNGMRHKTVWLDRTIDCNSIKPERVVREAAAAVVMIENYRINLSLFLLFASLLYSFPFSSFFLFVTARVVTTIIDQIKTTARCNISSSSSSSSNNNNSSSINTRVWTTPLVWYTARVTVQ